MDPHRIRYFAIDVLTLATHADPTWGRVEPIAHAPCNDELVTAVKVVAPGCVQTVTADQVPVAARMAAHQRRSSGRLQLAVLDQDARTLQPTDAHDVLQQILFRSIRYPA